MRYSTTMGKGGMSGGKTGKCKPEVYNGILTDLTGSGDTQPDRITDAENIVEVKCPYNAKDREITCVFPLSILREGLLVSCMKGQHYESMKLDQNHQYYYQIQGKLLCSLRSSYSLVVPMISK